jgi:hypothetical protein
MNGEGLEQVLRDLARESGAALAELGVRPSDGKWIREHARTIANLKEPKAGRGLPGLFRRLRRR